MGYLDKQSRVIDVVLTERGRRLYALGELNFAYFGLFDDGLDYDPYSTGSLTEEERQEQIEATPMMEAPIVRETRGTVAPGEPRSHLFTAGAQYKQIPQMISPTTASLSLMVDQRRLDSTYYRTGTSFATLEFSIIGNTEAGNPGYIVRVFSSGSNGLTPLDLRKDLKGRRAYDPFIAISIDDETPIDAPSVSKPNSSRVANMVLRTKG